MLRVLHVEDSANDEVLVRAELDKEFGKTILERVETPEAYVTALSSRKWDVIIADHRLPGFSAIDALEILKQSAQDIPFIIVSGSMGEDLAVNAMKAGAHDYVTKSDLTRLGAAVQRELREAHVRRERARAEAMLLEAQERLSILLESTRDRVFTFDSDLRVTSAYGAWLREEGHSADDLFGRTPAEIFGEDLGQHEAYYRRALAGDHAVYEWARELSTGRRHFQTSLSPLRSADGNIVGGAGIIRDITRLKEIEGQLVMSERMVSVGTLAASVAHEINNPLVCILASLSAANEGASDVSDPALRAQLTDALADARSASERVRDIARDLRILSRADKEQVGPVDIHAVLDSAARLAWNEVRHRARLERAYASTPPVRGSDARLGQVFLNLIVNAAQAIPEGNADANRIVLRTAVAGGGEVAVEIEDTGCGMSPEVLARLFTPFFTTKPAGIGTGLGLSISHRIVTALGGQIEARSRPGQGSVFRVVLPVDLAPQAAPTRSRPAAAPAPRRARILVVDDDVAVAKAIRRALASQHEITIADGPGAVARVEAGEEFDLVLCDLMMPVMTGMEVHARIHARAPALAERMLFVSGGAFTPAAQEFLMKGSARAIQKPFEPADLRRIVNEALA